MNTYIIAYDISDDERRTEIFESLRGWGDHLQYSVFRCELSRKEKAQLISELREHIKHDCDQVLLFDLGPRDGRARDTVDAIGVPYTHPERHAVIL